MKQHLSVARYIMKYSSALEKKFDFNWRGERFCRCRGRGRTHKWSASRSVKLLELPSEWKLSTLLRETSARKCEEALSPSDTLPGPASYRHLRPHLPSRSVLRRSGKYLSWLPLPRHGPLCSSFFRQARSRRE